MHRKVNFNVFTPFPQEIERQLEAPSIKRESVLNQLIDCEIPYLERDLNGKQLSFSAKRYIAK